MAEQSHDANSILPTAFQVDTATDWSTTNALKASQLTLSLTTKPKPVPSPGSEDILAHGLCTDHMIVARWTTQHGWNDPEMVPFAPISLSPTASVLHYSTSCFEGLKVHRGFDDKLRLFRPEYNCARMLASARRICLPEFDPEELLNLIKKLCEVDGPKWLPKGRHGESLYIRPTLMGSDSSLGFQVPGEALLIIMLSYWPAPTGSSNGLRLLCSDEYSVRSWPGGTGSAKISGNYAPSLSMQGEARRCGFDQVLWLFDSEGYITEAGSANFFTIWRNYEGKLQLVTPSLTDHLILPGVTRQSILDLASERLGEAAPSSYGCEPVEILEIMFTVADLLKASRDGRLLCAFVVSTACFMQPVVHVQYGEVGIAIPEESIPHMSMMRKWMKNIMFGYEKSPWTYELTDE